MSKDLIFYCAWSGEDRILTFGRLDGDYEPLKAPMQEWLFRMQVTKDNIKSAIESLGIDLTGATFSDYANIIDMRVLDV
jgi:hypothetical protein